MKKRRGIRKRTRTMHNKEYEGGRWDQLSMEPNDSAEEDARYPFTLVMSRPDRARTACLVLAARKSLGYAEITDKARVKGVDPAVNSDYSEFRRQYLFTSQIQAGRRMCLPFLPSFHVPCMTSLAETLATWRRTFSSMRYDNATSLLSAWSTSSSLASSTSGVSQLASVDFGSTGRRPQAPS